MRAAATAVVLRLVVDLEAVLVRAMIGCPGKVTRGERTPHHRRLPVRLKRGVSIEVRKISVNLDRAARERRVYHGVGKVALVVEDEPSVLDLVVTLLGESGWRVEAALGGRAGLDSVRRNRYDLIVSDIRMPDGDGQEFYEHALAHDPALRSRFIFITGDTAGDRARAFIDGAEVPVVEKPFSPMAFEEAVWRLMAAAAS